MGSVNTTQTLYGPDAEDRDTKRFLSFTLEDDDPSIMIVQLIEHHKEFPLHGSIVKKTMHLGDESFKTLAEFFRRAWRVKNIRELQRILEKQEREKHGS